MTGWPKCSAMQFFGMTRQSFRETPNNSQGGGLALSP